MKYKDKINEAYQGIIKEEVGSSWNINATAYIDSSKIEKHLKNKSNKTKFTDWVENERIILTKDSSGNIGIRFYLKDKEVSKEMKKLTSNINPDGDLNISDLW